MMKEDSMTAWPEEASRKRDILGKEYNAEGGFDDWPEETRRKLELWIKSSLVEGRERWCIEQGEWWHWQWGQNNQLLNGTEAASRTLREPSLRKSGLQTCWCWQNNKKWTLFCVRLLIISMPMLRRGWKCGIVFNACRYYTDFNISSWRIREAYVVVVNLI